MVIPSMDVCVSTDARTMLSDDGSLWTEISGFGVEDYRRYLSVFDTVRLVTRAKKTSCPPDTAFPVTRPGIVGVPVPYFSGAGEFMLKRARIRMRIREELDRNAAVILRAPHVLSFEIFRMLRGTRRPFGVEVVGDPWDAFQPGSIKTLLRPYLRLLFRSLLVEMCRRACAVAYVTENELQKSYPPPPSAFTTHYSSIELDEDMLRARSRVHSDPPYVIFHAGTMSTMYKSQDVLIQAVKRLVERGMDVRLRLAGSGKYAESFRRLARDLGILDRVDFLGQLAGTSAVMAEMDRATLFVLPSKTEGLPRVLIEAMARGLPCLGSDVGGIRELLEPEDRFELKNAGAIERKMWDVLNDQNRMARMAERNLLKASQYRKDILQKRRVEFYKRIKQATTEWIEKEKSLGISAR